MDFSFKIGKLWAQRKAERKGEVGYSLTRDRSSGSDVSEIKQYSD